MLGCSSKRRQVPSPGNVSPGHCDPQPIVLPALGRGVVGPRHAAQGISWLCEHAATGRWLGFSNEGKVPLPICCAQGAGTCWRAKLELLRCSLWPGSLPGGSSIPIRQALPPAALGISQVQVYLHCRMVLNGSKVASCFLAIMIPFFLSYAFHLEILEAFNC